MLAETDLSLQRELISRLRLVIVKYKFHGLNPESAIRISSFFRQFIQAA